MLQDEKLKKKVKVRRPRERFTSALVGGAGVEPAASPVLVSGRSTALSYPPAFFVFVNVRRHGAAEPRDNRFKSELILEEVNVGVKFRIFHTVESTLNSPRDSTRHVVFCS